MWDREGEKISLSPLFFVWFLERESENEGKIGRYWDIEVEVSPYLEREKKDSNFREREKIS